MINEIEVIKKIMANENLSYEGMARKLNVSWRTLHRWIKKETEPSKLALIQIRKFIEERK